jgi:hypothetical protein
VKHQTDVYGLAKATCLHRIRHVIYARCYFGPEYIREFRLDTVHFPCSEYKYVITSRLHNKFHFSTYVGDIAKMFRLFLITIFMYALYIIAL